MPLPRLPASATDAVHALAVRFGLSAGAESALRCLVAQLAFDPAAPTAVRDVQRVIEDHIADSLVALEMDVVRLATQAVDVGSGAGVPGLPLAIAIPSARFTLLESNQRKATFLLKASHECGLGNVEVVAERAEGWASGVGRQDLVTVRAVSDLDVVAEYAAPLLRVGGAMVAWRGARDPEAEARGERAALELGMELLGPVRVSPYPQARQRHLYVMSKVAETPTRFPRRPGVATKRPLGSGTPRGVCHGR